MPSRYATMSNVMTSHVRPSERGSVLFWRATIFSSATCLPQAEFVLCSQYDQAQTKLDPDHVAALVLEVAPQFSCLVFCASKKNCENVAQLICRFMPRLIFRTFLFPSSKCKKSCISEYVHCKNSLYTNYITV